MASSWKSELRMLRAIRTRGRRQPIELTATFMGAHEVPVEFRGRRARLRRGASST